VVVCMVAAEVCWAAVLQQAISSVCVCACVCVHKVWHMHRTLCQGEGACNAWVGSHSISIQDGPISVSTRLALLQDTHCQRWQSLRWVSSVPVPWVHERCRWTAWSRHHAGHRSTTCHWRQPVPALGHTPIGSLGCNQAHPRHRQGLRWHAAQHVPKSYWHALPHSFLGDYWWLL
jgi:hypothetical protein